MKRHPSQSISVLAFRLSLRVLALSLALVLGACGIRPYDYAVPMMKTLGRFTDQPTTTPSLPATFTPLVTDLPIPGPSLTPTQPEPGVRVVTPTATLIPTPPQGNARLILENNAPLTVYVRLRDGREWGIEIAAADVKNLDLPSGVYEYWVVLPGLKSLHGHRAVYPGVTKWPLYDTPEVLVPPTPMWPGIDLFSLLSPTTTQTSGS